jgi:hypothetical protein
MWAQYKKTFAGTQIMIALVCVAIFVSVGHSFLRTGVFFVVMQVGSIFGAFWAARISAALKRRASALPLKGIH